MYNNSIVKSGRSKAKVVAIAVVAVVLLAAIILICLKNLKSAKLSIMLAPYDSAVAKIDGKEYKSGTYSFMPRQNVTVTISAPGFEEKTVIVNLEKKHTATTISNHGRNGSNRVVTSELIYCWMIMQNIPKEFEKWPLNRLMTLIEVCSIESNPKKKRGFKETQNYYAQLNKARRAKYGSKG